MTVVNLRQAVHDARQIIVISHTMNRVSSASDVLLKNSLASLPANLQQHHCCSSSETATKRHVIYHIWQFIRHENV